MSLSSSPHRRNNNLLWWALALIVGGVLLLLFNFDLLAAYEPLAQYITAGVLGIAGLAFLLSFFRRRVEWWRVLPGWTLLALAGMVALAAQPGIERPFVAAVLFVGLTLAFVHVYLVNRMEHWWALIPGGFMLVLAAVIALTTRVERVETLGTLLFAGMGLVFFAVYLLAGWRRHWWALIPGAVLLLFAVVIYTVDNVVQSALLRWWPLALIVTGAILAYIGAMALPKREKLIVNVAPPAPRQPTVASETAAGEIGQLGDYQQPAPGASVELLPDADERR